MRLVLSLSMVSSIQMIQFYKEYHLDREIRFTLPYGNFIELY